MHELFHVHVNLNNHHLNFSFLPFKFADHHTTKHARLVDGCYACILSSS